MYALAINGSPRAGGNTEYLLKEVLAPLEKEGWNTEIIKIGGTPLRGCLACRKCFEKKDNQCIMKNDDFNKIFEKVLRADAIILGSPTFYTDVTAEMKAFIDRTGYVAAANGKALSGKIGTAVMAVRRGGSIHAFDTMNHLFQISRMIIQGSTYWNMAYGMEKGDVAEDSEGISNMKDLGRSIAWLGKTLEPHKKSFPVFEA
ncbi:MAG: flavodoxin family protein [Spirochaetales bacterium]|nr:flavodoxin family protein [Spirochaetales bacterium]